MALSAVLFPLLVCGTAFMINFIAIYYHASRAIPFATMVSWIILTLNALFLHTVYRYIDKQAMDTVSMNRLVLKTTNNY